MTARELADKKYGTKDLEDISEFNISLESAVSMMEEYKNRGKNLPIFSVSKSAFVEMLQKQQNKVCISCGDIEKAGYLDCGCRQDGFNKGIEKAIEMFMSYYC